MKTKAFISEALSRNQFIIFYQWHSPVHREIIHVDNRKIMVDMFELGHLPSDIIDKAFR